VHQLVNKKNVDNIKMHGMWGENCETGCCWSTRNPSVLRVFLGWRWAVVISSARCDVPVARVEALELYIYMNGLSDFIDWCIYIWLS